MKNEKINSLISYLLVFLLVIVVSIAVLWYIKGGFLQKYYIKKQINAMEEAYEKVNAASNNGTIDSDEFDDSFQSIVERYNLDILILDTETKAIKSSAPEKERLELELIEYVFDIRPQSNYDIISQDGNVEIRRVISPRNEREYLDMWGILDNGNPFLIRSSLDSIYEATKVAGNFFSNIVVAVSVAMLVSLFFYKRHRNLLEYKKKNVQLQHDIEQKEKLENMRSEFISNVSHELKTPIALINGYAEGLIEGVNDDEESRRFYCEVIQDEANKMNALVKKILDLNNIEFGEISLSNETFDIVESVKNYIEARKILIDSSNAKVVFENTNSIMVFADEYYVQEVFDNYFSNALHYVKNDMRIEIRITTEEDRAKISVFNTGDNIPTDCIEHVFEKFYKVDKARTRSYGGSGVGLSIVKAIMDLMGQDYGVTNCPDGVIFYFTLKLSSDNAYNQIK